jgi:Transglutaminase-like superfamily
MINLTFVMLSIAFMSENQSFHFVDQYVDTHMQYQFYYHPRDIRQILKDGIGDCTDYAQMKCYLLRQGHKEACRYVHGYLNGQKHDWIQVAIGNKWIASENTTITGYGLW